MKKIFIVILTLFASLVLIACQDNSSSTNTTITQNPTTVLTTKPWVYQAENTGLSYNERVALYNNQFNIGLFVSEDLTTSIGINFELPKQEKGFVEYKTVTGNEIITKEASYKSTLVGKKTVHHFEAVLTNLVPDTVYEYRVRNESCDTVSDIYQFKTKSVNPNSFSFLFLADPQENSVLGYMAYSHGILNVLDEVTQKPDFMMFSGDVVNDADVRSEWNNFFTYSSPFIYNTPIMATTGNHDISGISGNRMTNFEFDGYLNLPNNGPTYTPFDEIENDVRPANFDDGKTYSFNFDNTHFVAINTESLCDGTTTCSKSDTSNLELLKTWLNQDLSSHSMKWTIVLMHRGAYSLSYDTYKVREELVPIFETHNVDLVFSGHDHQYSRSIYSEESLVAFNRSDSYSSGSLFLTPSIETDYHFNDYSSSLGVTYLVGNTASTKFYGGEKNSGISTQYAFIDSHPVIPYITISDASIEVISYALSKSSELQIEVDSVYILESFKISK